MEKSNGIFKKFKILNIGKIPLYVIIVIFVFLLAVIQDYIYSRIQQTGFYLSESLLYNVFWAFFVPLSILINQLMKIIKPKNIVGKIFFHLGIGLFLSFLHLLLFTLIFVFVSNLVFTPPHHFSTIFYAAFSNQFYIALLWYTIFPAIFISIRAPTTSTSRYLEKIKLKIGSKIMPIPTSSIQLISKDKPYSIIYANDQKFLDKKSLKEFETKLDPSIFLRVHRSTIINATYVVELKSRSNGDYDARLANGQIIRLSRHYRNNWCQLLQ